MTRENQETRDARYVDILTAPIAKSGNHKPRMGGKSPVELDQFLATYGGDLFYHWMGLDTELLYAAHKAAGGITSIYRQLGIGSERLIRAIFRDELALNEEQVNWKYEIHEGTGDQVSTRTLSLDGRLESGDIGLPEAKQRVDLWVERQKENLNISIPLRGSVFEIRQGYKSADSKRQNADLTNAVQAISHGYLPVLFVMSSQVNSDVEARYRIGNWVVLKGSLGPEDSSDTSTFKFMEDVIGYSLADFFRRNSRTLRNRTEDIIANLLEAK